MIFHPLLVLGAFRIEVEPHEDERGYFARTWCHKEFAQAGIHFSPIQTSLSFNKLKGTLRGVHFQRAPYVEAKIVQCLKGRLFDVIVDLRPTSQSYRKWVGITLSGKKKNMVYVPEGCAHGYITLTGDCLISYMISKEYTEESAQGIRWDDPSIGITWPQLPLHVSDKDSSWPFLTQI